MSGLLRLDETSGLASFGPGTTRARRRGGAPGARPHARPLPAELGALDRRRMGRDPVRRPAVARLRPDRRALRRRHGSRRRPARSSFRRTRRRPPGPDLRQLVLGSEGRLGIVTDVDPPHLDPAGRRGVPRGLLPGLGAGARRDPRTRPGRAAARHGPPLDACRDRDQPRARRPRGRLRGAAARISRDAASAAAGRWPSSGSPGAAGSWRRPRARRSASSPATAGSACRASAPNGGRAGSARPTCGTRSGTRATRSTRSRRQSTGPPSRRWPPGSPR